MTPTQTATTSSTSTTLDSVTPLFPVRDLPEALTFYRQTLGFDLAWSWGEPAHIAAVCRDRVEITLTASPDGRATGPARVYLRVSGIDAYYARLQQAGAEILVPIGDRAYGMRDFRVADPSGNELDVGQVLDEETGA